MTNQVKYARLINRQGYYCAYAYVLDFCYVLGILSNNSRHCGSVDCSNCLLKDLLDDK